jgi:anti-sigma factor RsiW
MSHLGERLSALVDGELSLSQRDRVLAHLARCEPCRAEAAALRALKRRMRALGEASAGAALTDRLMALGAPVGAAGCGTQGMPGASGAGEVVPRWPVLSLALAALVLLALGLPAAAFVAGGGRQEPGPSVTPPVAMFMIQHALAAGGMAAGDRPPASASRGAARRGTGAAARTPARQAPVAAVHPPRGTVRPTLAVTRPAVTAPPSRRDAGGPSRRPASGPYRRAPGRSPANLRVMPLPSG